MCRRKGRPFQIEFTGPTGAGKSSLAEMVAAQLADRGCVVGVVHERIRAPQAGLPNIIGDVSAHNWRTDLAVAPSLLHFVAKYPVFSWFVICLLVSSPEPAAMKLNILRSVWRKLGVFLYLRRARFSGWHMVIDEGLLHSAHNLLVSPLALASDDHVSRFFSLVPSSDLVVLVMAPPEILVSRLRARGELSPRVRGTLQINEFAQRAYQMFESLGNSERFRKRMIRIDSRCSQRKAVASIVAEILSRSSARTD